MIASYQTFPIHVNTYTGTATDESPRVEKLVKALADCTITFTFTDASTLAIDVLSGFDCVVGNDIHSITSDDAILLS